MRVETHGNRLTAAMLLHGHAVEQVTQEELQLHDPLYEMTTGLYAAKPAHV